jgi:glycine/D-amino acid oxidase-like deaminating enzyme
MGLLIEPPIYLNALTRDFQIAGGRIVVRDFPDLRSVLALSEPVVVNCSGLGSRSLFSDENMYPGKGQLLVFVPQSEVDYELEFMDLVSRKDGLVLGGGGGGNRNDWTLEPNEEAGRKSMASAIEFFSAMR